MNEAERLQRNINPHKEALLAIYVWGGRYSQQSGGCMDFWDSLSKHDKEICVYGVDTILNTPHRASEPEDAEGRW